MAASIVHISSTEQFSSLISSSHIVVADFHAVWCGPCKAIAPVYEQLSTQLSRPNRITFTKIDVDQQKQLASAYGVTAMPTFMIFKNARVVSTIRGADPRKLTEAIRKLAAEAQAEGANNGTGFSDDHSSSRAWLGASLPKGYADITDQVDLKGLDLLNCDSDYGTARTLFDTNKPSGGSSVGGKGKATAGGEEKKPDWVESDTDEQLMLFMPFNSALKIHSLHITSLPPASEDDDNDVPMRPKTIQVYPNLPQVLGFEEADDIPATQSITLGPRDWDPKTGTAKIELRFVKFQNVTSLVIFVVDGDGDGDKVRVDRLRILGDTGEKRDPGKLEKIGDEPGE